MCRSLLAILAACAVLAASAPHAGAEKVDMSPDQLRAAATHVVVGTVQAIYARERREGDWRVTERVAELQVEAVEKGEGLPAGRVAYVRYWTRRWSGWGAPPPSTAGHRGLPAEGERLRAYLARDAYNGFGAGRMDGGLDVLGANGFERLPAPAGPGR